MVCTVQLGRDLFQSKEQISSFWLLSYLFIMLRKKKSSGIEAASFSYQLDQVYYIMLVLCCLMQLMTSHQLTRAIVESTVKLNSIPIHLFRCYFAIIMSTIRFAFSSIEALPSSIV